MKDRREYYKLYNKQRSPEKVKTNRDKQNKRCNPIYNPRRMWFKRKHLILKDNPRTGVCSICRRQGLTHIHHIKYHEDDPLRDTIELCASCHKTEHLIFSMVKDTHSVQDIESLMFEYTNKIKNAETKTEKTALLKKLKELERHWNSVNDKNINGKKYPTKKVPPKTTREELFKLIDSIGKIPKTGYEDEPSEYKLDISGVSVGKNRFEFVELG